MKNTILRALALLATGLIAHADEIRVAAAASLTEAVTEIANAYGKEAGGNKATPVFAASNVLARQIEEGAPIDVFISADEANMTKVEKASLVKDSAPLLTNSLVVVVPNDSPTKVGSAADLDGLKRIAIGDPAAVPAGVYAKAWLTKAGLWEKIQPKTVPSENVRAALAAVEAGNVDAAIVYKTDAAVSKKTKVAWTVPATDVPAIVYPVAICTASKHAEDAKKFVAFLQSAKATEIFKARGFGIAEVPAAK
ncbi:molybdate ABC transporter substrate-binding protein [Haloferula sp. BvORR071]|uniref:molybdate ABC transporter substrate-binding protein n=1 Tax=Haloferula sp. BvORR071 TaxID=1396141 RepID=UPI00055800F5|nr:molybdate ABC transporter substrate-binding protein [Haloferula sp. BvORR071]